VREGGRGREGESTVENGLVVGRNGLAAHLHAVNDYFRAHLQEIFVPDVKVPQVRIVYYYTPSERILGALSLSLSRTHTFFLEAFSTCTENDSPARPARHTVEPSRAVNSSSRPPDATPAVPRHKYKE